MDMDKDMDVDVAVALERETDNCWFRQPVQCLVVSWLPGWWWLANWQLATGNS